MIELAGFNIGHGRGKLLNDIDAHFCAGQLTALIGRNGAGKSTLLRAIAGLNRRYGGTIRLAGRDMRTMDSAETARTLAFVGTDRTRVGALRCRDIVAIGRAPYTNWLGHMQEVDRRAVDEAIESVGMTDYADQSTDRMSDGECQRIMIARALAQATPVMLLDEPTSFLDLPGRYELCRLLARLAHEHEKCIIFSTHDLEIAMRTADRIALIDSPRLICMPADELSRSGEIQRVFGLPDDIPGLTLPRQEA
jgi:iron complex transport system ATP-binding protein